MSFIVSKLIVVLYLWKIVKKSVQVFGLFKTSLVNIKLNQKRWGIFTEGVKSLKKRFLRYRHSTSSVPETIWLCIPCYISLRRYQMFTSVSFLLDWRKFLNILKTWLIPWNQKLFTYYMTKTFMVKTEI